ncbi:MarR family winged helix-turn-helix transcriptional regulator [Micromonosporaceae bacterium Da 78-11]
MTASPVRQSTDLMQLLTRAERLLARRLTTILAAQGHTLDDWRVLSLLADGAGHFMTDLAEQAFLPPGSLTRLVDRLVDEGLLYRRVDDVDRRRIRAYLTARGHRLHERVAHDVQNSLAEVNTGPSDQLERELGALITSLGG